MQNDVRVSTAPAKRRKPAPLYPFVEDLKRFKGFARKLAIRSPGNKGSLLLEWASSVTDLHRVLDVTRSMYLMSQSHNEILMRVGLELATSKIARKIFQWTDGDWYADDSKREWFRDVVQTNLSQVLDAAACANAGENCGDERLAAANRKVTEVQAELSVAVQKCQAAEALVERRHSQMQALQHNLDAKSEDALRTQQQLDEAQAKLKEARANMTSVEMRLRESQKLIVAAEAKLHDADARCLGLEAELRHAKEDARSKNATAPSLRSEAEGQLQSQASQLQVSETISELSPKSMVELESWISAAESAQSQAAELRSVVCKLQDQVSLLQAEASSTGGTVTQTSDLEEALIDLNIKFTRLSEENTQLRSQLDRALGSSCMTTCTDQNEHAPSSTVPDEGRRVDRSDAVPSPLTDAGLIEALENTKAALRKLELENKELRRELDGLHTNIKAIVNAGGESSAAMQVASIIDNLDMKREWKGACTTSAVWDRLYTDAMDRIDRMERHRKDGMSPTKSLTSPTMSFQESEHVCQMKPVSQQPPSQMEPDSPERSRDPSSDPLFASMSNLTCTSWSSPPKQWSLPPCSPPSRQARCPSAHRLRASRQASRALQSPSRRPYRSAELEIAPPRCSTALSPSKKIESSISLPSLHGHRLRR